MRRAGAFAEREVVAPELYRRDLDGRIHERHMDLVATWPGEGRGDAVWWTSPSGPRSRAALPQKRSQAPQLMRGAADKRRHYNDSAWPFAMAPAGRLDAAGLALLAALARDTSNLGPAMPGAVRAGRICEAALRADIEAEVTQHDTDRSLAALGSEATCSIGWATTRAAPTAV